MMRSAPKPGRSADSDERRKDAPTQTLRAKYSDGFIDMPLAAAPKYRASAAPPPAMRP